MHAFLIECIHVSRKNQLQYRDRMADTVDVAFFTQDVALYHSNFRRRPTYRQANHMHIQNGPIKCAHKRTQVDATANGKRCIKDGRINKQNANSLQHSTASYAMESHAHLCIWVHSQSRGCTSVAP